MMSWFDNEDAVDDEDEELVRTRCEFDVEEDEDESIICLASSVSVDCWLLDNISASTEVRSNWVLLNLLLDSTLVEFSEIYLIRLIQHTQNIQITSSGLYDSAISLHETESNFEPVDLFHIALLSLFNLHVVFFHLVHFLFGLWNW